MALSPVIIGLIVGGSLLLGGIMLKKSVNTNQQDTGFGTGGTRRRRCLRKTRTNK
jgi:hypothetical protein